MAPGQSLRRCPRLTSAPPCLPNQEVLNKRLGSLSRALAESSYPTENLPPTASLSPGTVVTAQLCLPLTALAWAPCGAPAVQAPGEKPLLSRGVQPRQGTLPGNGRCTAHREQGCSRATTAKPWERAAPGAGLKLQPSSLQRPFPAPPKPPPAAKYRFHSHQGKTHRVRHSGLQTALY